MTEDTFHDGSSNRATDRGGDAPDHTVPKGDGGHLVGTSRRTFMKAAGASAGALTVGTSVTSADGHDGDLPQLYVEGNRIVDAEGTEPPLRGVTITDPKGLDVTAPARGKDASQVLDLVTDAERGWHPTLVRIVVRPQHLGEFALEEMDDAGAPPAFEQAQVERYAAEHLDPVIDQLAAAGVYAVVDFQREDSLGDYDWTAEAIGTEIERFWEVVAPRYAERNHVLYELYGIPTGPGIWGDPTENDWQADTWHQWKETAQPWVDLIREHAPETIVIVGTPGYNRSPEGVLVAEFEGANLAYAYHNYAGFDVNDEQDWDGVGPSGGGTMGAAEEVPLFVTEFGWRNDSVEGDSRSETFEGSTSGYGEPFVEWMESQPGLYWTAAAADPAWFTPTFSAPFSDLTGEELRQLDPYGGDVPQQCSELPCEWDLLGEAEGDYDTYMGAFVKDTLAELQSDVDLSAPDTTRPAPPATVTVEDASDSTVTVSWAAVDGAQEYAVSVDGERVQTVAGTEATVTELRPARSYGVGVATVDADGVASTPYAVQAETDEPVAEAPSAPENLEIEALSEGLSAAWDAVDGAESYNVFLEGDLVEETTATEATLSAADRSAGPTVGVSAVGSAGESTATESTWTPLSERVAHIDIMASDNDVAPGDQIDVSVSLSSVHSSLTGLDYRFVVDYVDGDRPAVVRDADVTSDLGTATVEEVGDDGAVSVAVSHRDVSLEDASGSRQIATFTIEGRSKESVTLYARDIEVHYDLAEKPAGASVTTDSLYVRYDDEDFADVDLGPELSVAPGSVARGETLEATFSIQEPHELLDGFDFSFATAAADGGDPPLEIQDVDLASEFGTYTVTGMEDEGTTSMGVELRDGAPTDVSEPIELATATLEAVADGTGTVRVDDPAARYEPIDPRIDVASPNATVEVGAEPALQPTGLVEVEERTAPTVELSWLEVPEASEYAVYATEYDVTNAAAADVDEISPLTPPTEDALVERTDATTATVDGLDAGTSYEVGVVAVGPDGATSPIASRPVTTASETTPEVVPEIGVELDSDVIDEPDSTQASLLLSDPPSELAGYVVEVRVADPAIATIEDVEFGSTFSLTQVRSEDDDGEWVTFEGLDADGAIDGDPESVDLATLSLDAVEPGSTDVVVTAEPLTLSSASTVDVRTRTARLSVDVDNWNGTMQADGVVYEPTDADKDGLYRDVTGDGSVTNADVTVFFRNQHTDVVQNNPELFDFDRDGRASQADVIELFRDVTGN